MKTNYKFTIYILLVFSFYACNNAKSDQAESFPLLWEFEYTQDADGLSLVNTNPAVLNSQILIAPDKQLTLLNTKDGNVKWQFAIPGSPYISTEEFLTEGSTLYLKEDQNQMLFSIDLDNGTSNWEKDISPLEFYQRSNDGIDNDFLYLSGSRGEIYRFTKQGQLTKTYDVTDYGIETSARSIRVLDNQLIFSQRWREGNNSNANGRILSIDKETEDLLWEYRTENGGYIFEPIILEDGIIYAGVTDGPGEFSALDAESGQVIWRNEGLVTWSFTLSDTMIFVNNGIRMVALDKQTGQELWRTSFGGGYDQDNIAYLDGYLYHSHGSALFILDTSTGEIVHSEPRSPDGSPFGLAAAGNERVFVQSNYALYAYEAWK